MPSVPPSAPPTLGAGEDHYDRISSSSEPPPYSAVLAKTPRLSLDTQVGCDWLTMWSRDDMLTSDWSQDERQRRRSQGKARRRVKQMKVGAAALFFVVFLLSIV